MKIACDVAVAVVLIYGVAFDPGEMWIYTLALAFVAGDFVADVRAVTRRSDGASGPG